MLNGEIFYTLKEAKIVIEAWRRCLARRISRSANFYQEPQNSTEEPLQEAASFV